MEGLDFASAVQQVLSAAEPATFVLYQMTVEEIEHVLNHVASACEFSSPLIRAQRLNTEIDSTAELKRLFQRVDSVQAKWLIRLVLKDLRPAVIPEMIVLRQFHFLLPDCLVARNSLAHALRLLEGLSAHGVPPCPSQETDMALRPSVWANIEPQLGVMIGLPSFEKARSINHCCQLVRNQEVSVERKYDGEYCQIHVGMMNLEAQIQIFTKSGRDSTDDRISIHSAIKQSLGIGSLAL